VCVKTCKYNYIVIQLSQDKHRLMRNAKLWLRCGKVNAAAVVAAVAVAMTVTATDVEDDSMRMHRQRHLLQTDVNVCIAEILIAFT